jgi:ubiquinone/menaquinone biosynthesis C-methylase UbiE
MIQRCGAAAYGPPTSRAATISLIISLFSGNKVPPAPTDVWFEWLVKVRSGGDAAFEATLRSEVGQYVDRILDQSGLRAGMTLVDVGTGEGAVAFRAIERFGPTLRVVLTDISEPLLLRAQARAAELGVQEQCTFIACGADRLAGIETGSVDVVTTRSALAYVRDKAGALSEFNRVLKPGGRIALGEPIFQDDAFHACVLRSLVQSERSSTSDPLHPLLHRWKAAQFPDTPEGIAANPLTNFSERVLFEMVRSAGFSPVHLEFHVDVMPSHIPSWQVFLETSPHPLAPALGDIMENQFSQEERQLFEAAYRPLIESGRAMTVLRMAYVSGTKAPSESAGREMSGAAQ